MGPPGASFAAASLYTDHVEGALAFDVEEGIVRGRRTHGVENYGAVFLPHRWILPQ